MGSNVQSLIQVAPIYQNRQFITREYRTSQPFHVITLHNTVSRIFLLMIFISVCFFSSLWRKKVFIPNEKAGKPTQSFYFCLSMRIFLILTRYHMTKNFNFILPWEYFAYARARTLSSARFISALTCFAVIEWASARAF